MLVASDNEKKHRVDRISISLSAVVKFRESRESVWNETADLTSISRTGAGFYFEKECQVGRLISLLLKMPRHLRCYDRDKELYRVWGLVQHCSPIAGEGDSGYHVGIAFVGKKAPPSYSENPVQSYRIAGINEDGTWRIVDAKTTFVSRRHPRYWVSLEVFLSTNDDNDNKVVDGKARTENLSSSGAAVFTDLNVDVGASLNIKCAAHNFSAWAVVRDRHTYDHQPPKLHIEFIDAAFPVERISLAAENGVLDEDEISADEENPAPIEESAEV